MATWKIPSEIEPNYAGGLMRAKWLIGGIRTVKTLAQRNAIPALYRYFSVEESTIVFVEDESQLYRLNNNPSGTTANSDWTLITLGNISSSLTPIGTWNVNNTEPAITDEGAAGTNGSFYFVTGAPTPQDVTIAGLFEGATTTVVDGNMIISVGTRWVVVSNSTAWNSIDKPQSIIDYVDGTVIAHTHTVADITDLGTYLTNYLTRNDVADSTIDFDAVPDTDVITTEFVKKYYYRKSEIDSQLASLSQSFLGLSDTPSSYTGYASKIVRVNALENALEFIDPPATDLGSVLSEGNNAGGLEILNLAVGTQPTSALRRADILDGGGLILSTILPTINLPWANLTGVPTTLAGYGITDASTTAYIDGHLAGKTLAAPTITEDTLSIRWNNTLDSWEYFVPGSGGGSSYVFQNGLTENGGVVKLNGNLTEQALLNTGLESGSFEIEIPEDNFIMGKINFVMSASAGLRLTSYAVSDISKNIEFRIGEGAIKIRDTRVATLGIQYMGDYSANFTDRSLIDKGYGDGAYWKTSGNSLLTGHTDIQLALTDTLNIGIGEGTVAFNRYGPSLVMGGTGWGNGAGAIGLVWSDELGNFNDLYVDDGGVDITIATASEFKIAGGSAANGFVGAVYSTDYSANFTARSLVDKAYVDGLMSGGSGWATSGTTIVTNPVIEGDPTFNGLVTILGPTTSLSTALLDVSAEFNPASGTNTFAGIELAPTYNTTGTYTGSVRGIYYNPEVTSLTGATHYAFHSTSGSVFLGNSVTDSIDANVRLGIRGISGGDVIKAESQTGTALFTLKDSGIIQHKPPVLGGSSTIYWLTGGLTVASGFSTYTGFFLNPSFNTTGTYEGILRGFFYNPVITSVTGATHYSFHATSGNMFLANSLSDVISSRTKLDVLAPGSGASYYVFKGRNDIGSLLFSLSGVGAITHSPEMASGTSNSYYLGGGISKSSGTADFINININPFYNTSGTFSGNLRGIYYNPSLNSVVGATHYAIHTTSGNILFGSTSSDTLTGGVRFEVRGLGTSSDKIIRLANSSNVEQFAVYDSGIMLVPASIRPVAINTAFEIYGHISTSASAMLSVRNLTLFSATSGIQRLVNMTINGSGQSGTAGWTGLELFNDSDSASTGLKRFINCLDPTSTSVFSVRKSGDTAIASTASYHLGDPDTDGTWRFFRSGDDLLIQQREAGVYNTKSTISGT